MPFGTGTRPPGAVRLVCLPHAGAGASVYRAWSQGLASTVVPVLAQPPGREGRSWDEPYRDAEALTADLVEALAPVFDEPFAVFGHSMGALLAFELVREIRRRGWPAPEHLFVAGRHAPHLAATSAPLYDVSDEELVAEMRGLGGTPEAVLNDPDLLATILPLLRADLSVNETYRYAPEPPLDVPVTAFAATADRRAGREGVAAWRAQTSCAFTLHVLPGDHFAVVRQAAFVHSRIVDGLAARLVPEAS
ncbi:thioesterase [Plantactinospora sp. S1510]|uniref:Thioesterase n=1 Tax=Plantactinospora alkalitolerans TaxID=2789879 RepID=A0ABS0H2V9_9ACTN|nr:thioesterase [Plantactinospora alkalitolerans]